MKVNLTPQLEALVRAKVDAGMYSSASDVVCEALRLMEEQDRRQQAKLDALRSAVREGLGSGASEPWDAAAVKQTARLTRRPLAERADQ